MRRIAKWVMAALVVLLLGTACLPAEQESPSPFQTIVPPDLPQEDETEPTPLIRTPDASPAETPTLMLVETPDPSGLSREDPAGSGNSLLTRRSKPSRRALIKKVKQNAYTGLPRILLSLPISLLLEARILLLNCCLEVLEEVRKISASIE